MERLYCGDGIVHIHVESFRSHISMTRRTPALFIFRWVAAIGHGMKYHLNALDKCLRGEEQEATKLLFIKAGESKERVLEDYLGWGLC